MQVLVSKMWAYSSHGRGRSRRQSSGRDMQQSVASRFWFAYSVWSLVWGGGQMTDSQWLEVLDKNTLYTWEMNWGPRSAVMSEGIP